jgi:hypothetical protein
MGWLKAFFRRHIIQDVPDEMAACEFDCKVTECTYGNWKHCKNRLLYAKKSGDRVPRRSRRATVTVRARRVSKRLDA